MYGMSLIEPTFLLDALAAPLNAVAHAWQTAAGWPTRALLFDAVIGPVAQETGTSPVALFLPVFIVETLVLWLLRWGTLARSALGSLAMNLTSTLLGLLLNLSYPEGIPPAFIISVLVEGFVLMLFNRQRKRRTWLSALAANFASYALLVGYVLMTRGRY